MEVISSIASLDGVIGSSSWSLLTKFDFTVEASNSTTTTNTTTAGDGRTDGWTNDERTDGRTDGSTNDERTDGRTKKIPTKKIGKQFGLKKSEKKIA